MRFSDGKPGAGQRAASVEVLKSHEAKASDVEHANRCEIEMKLEEYPACVQPLHSRHEKIIWRVID